MKLSDKPRRKAAYFHVTFYDESWSEIPSLSRQFLTAHEMMEHVASWNSHHQAFIRKNDVIPTIMGSAQSVGIEVHYES